MVVGVPHLDRLVSAVGEEHLTALVDILAPNLLFGSQKRIYLGVLLVPKLEIRNEKKGILGI